LRCIHVRKTEQEDIQIEHVEVDEARRQAEVDAGILQQVDGLVEYFNGLHAEDQATIEQLEGQLASKDHIIAALHSTQRQGPAVSAPVALGPQRQQKGQAAAGSLVTHNHISSSMGTLPLIGAGEESGGSTTSTWWARVLDSWVARPRAWLCCLVVTLALLALIIGLAAGLAPRRQQSRTNAAPAFLYPPLVLSPGNGTVNLQVALSRTGVIHYIVVPATQVSGSIHVSDVVLASLGLLSGSRLEVGGRGQ